MVGDDLETPEFGKPSEDPIIIVPDAKVRSLTDTRKVCKGTKKDGNPCGMYINEKYDYCVVHNPEITPEVRQQWRKRAGNSFHNALAKKLGHSIRTPAGVLAFCQAYLSEMVEKYGMSNIQISKTVVEILKVAIVAQKEAREQKLMAIPQDKKHDGSVEIIETQAERVG